MLCVENRCFQSVEPFTQWLVDNVGLVIQLATFKCSPLVPLLHFGSTCNAKVMEAQKYKTLGAELAHEYTLYSIIMI